MQESNGKVNLAFVGLGWWGQELADATLRSGVGQIAACYARTESTRLEFAEKYDCQPADDLEEILRDPAVDGIVAATPHSHHVPLIVETASAGKHIFMEKPFTLSANGAKKAIAAAEEAGVVLQIGHQRRRQAANRRLRAMLEEGKLGTPHQIEANLSLYKPQPPTWRSNPQEQPLGAMTGLGVHMIDTVQYLNGPISRVFTFSKEVTGMQGGLDEATVVAAEFEQGALGYIGFSLCVPKVCTVAVFGNEAAAWSEEEGSRLFFQSKEEFKRQEMAVDAGDPLAEQMAEFAAAIRGGTTPEVDGQAGLLVVAVMEALMESHRSGRPVDTGDYR